MASVAQYEGLAKELILKLKFAGAQQAAREIATLAATLLAVDASAVLVPVPTATSRTRKRGYDQAILLAREISMCSKFAYENCLRRLGQDEQLGSNRRQRVTQLAQAYRLVTSSTIEGRHVILIDDVMTTGATLEAAAKTIKLGGARRVSALVFAEA